MKLRPGQIKRMCFVDGDGRTAKTVKDAVGCDDILNASFYGTYIDDAGNVYKTPVFHLCNEGLLIADPGYDDYGISWNSSEDGVDDLDYGVKRLPNDENNTWVSGFRLLDEEQDENDPLDKEIPSYYVKRGRTLMGIDDDGNVIIYVCKDGTSHALTATQCREKMLEIGCKYAVMLDGGGSSQCDFSNGEYIRSTRAVANYICIWEQAEEKPEPDPEPEKKVYYRVQVGAFSKKQNAENYKLTMVELGYKDAFVKAVTQPNGTTLYKVQIGSFGVYENAKNLEAKLEAQGINAFVSMAIV